MTDSQLTKETQVVRYDCGSGGAQYCQGCYQMERSEYGDYVRWEDYERLQARIDALMLEYCPNEMTAEQMQRWAESQQVSQS